MYAILILQSFLISECNCGQTFSCSYSYFGAKTCLCETGYTEVTGTCKGEQIEF